MDSRTPRRIVEIFSNLNTELATRIVSQLRARPSSEGIREVTDHLLSPHTTPVIPQVEVTAVAMSNQLQTGVSSSIHIDWAATSLARRYPRDAGAVVTAMLSPVSLRPSKALSTPPEEIHAYASGLGVEIMMSSDDTLCVGLIEKHVGCQELLSCPGYVITSPMRIVPE